MSRCIGCHDTVSHVRDREGWKPTGGDVLLEFSDANVLRVLLSSFDSSGRGHFMATPLVHRPNERLNTVRE